jgi:hypothetical protein
MRKEQKMPAEKTIITRTKVMSVVTSLGITIVLLTCCFVILYELKRPLNIVTTDVGARMTSINSNRGFDDFASAIRTTTYATTHSALKSEEEYGSNQNHPSIISSTIPAKALLHRCSSCEEQKIGFVGSDISKSDGSSSRGHHSRRRYSRHRTSAGKNSNNNDFDMSGKETNDTLTDRSSSNNTINRNDIGTDSSISRNIKLIHSSFRIEQDVVKSLERAAATRDISLSSLVNKILKNYVTSEMFFEELGFLLVSKNFLRKTFEVLDEKRMKELGTEYGLTIAKEYISFFYPQVNVGTLIQFLEIWFKRFQSCHHRVGENDNYVNDKLHHYFTVNHDINMNFSLALQSILAGLIEPIIRNNVEFTNVTPNTITFSFAVFRE